MALHILNIKRRHFVPVVDIQKLRICGCPDNLQDRMVSQPHDSLHVMVVRIPIDSEKDKICTEKKSMEHRERIECRIDQLLFLGALITNRDPFVGLTVIINLSCRTTTIIYSVKISLTYGILLHANVITRVPRYKYRMYALLPGR